MKKLCSVCHKRKDVAGFNKHHERKDGLQSHCKVCTRFRFREYYRLNRVKQLKVVMARRKRIDKINRIKLLSFLGTHPCIDCGEKDPIVLDFDHRGNKTAQIADLMGGGFSWNRIEEEMNKCDVRCANCHRRKTAKERNNYRYIASINK